MIIVKFCPEAELVLLQLPPPASLSFCGRNILIYARLHVAESGNLTEKGFESRRASETLIEKVPPSQFVAFVTLGWLNQAIARLSATSGVRRLDRGE